MTCDKTKQLLSILQWQALVVSVQDNDKMDVIVQCRGSFYKFGRSGKDYVQIFNFRVKITKDVKTVKEFKETTRYLFLMIFLGLFYLVFLLVNATPWSRGRE